VRTYIQSSNKIAAEEVKFATRFMYSLLVTPYLHDRTTIIIEFKEQLKRRKKSPIGLSWPLDVNAFPKRFKIQIDASMGRRRQLLTLAHELVHVKQFSKNEIGSTTNKNKTRWKKKMIDENTVHYFDLPWEVEANGREYGLYKRYENFRKKHKIRFD
jgi:Zn-dependent peptidase ImmA (M78 family)